VLRNALLSRTAVPSQKIAPRGPLCFDDVISRREFGMLTGGASMALFDTHPESGGERRSGTPVPFNVATVAP
jgi:hypothetical protein